MSTVERVRCTGFTAATESLLVGLAGTSEPHPDGGFTLAPGAAVHLLNVLRDRPDAGFPGGKWATIQHLEQCIAEARR